MHYIPLLMLIVNERKHFLRGGTLMFYVVFFGGGGGWGINSSLGLGGDYITETSEIW